MSGRTPGADHADSPRPPHFPSAEGLFAGATLSKLGHELRGPVSGIIGLTGIMMRALGNGTANPTEQARQLGLINQSARELLTTVERVITLAQLSQPGIAPADEQFDCRVAVLEAVEACSANAAVHGKTIRTSTPEEPIMALGAQRAAVQAITELVDNAIKYSDHTDIDVRTSQQRSTASVEVHDAGGRLTGDELARVRQPFERGSAVRPEQPGAGLGLPIAEQLAARNGACLSAATSATGTDFIITFESLRPTEQPHGK